MNNRGNGNKDDILSTYLSKDNIREPKFIDTDSIVEISTGKPMPKTASSRLRDEQNPSAQRNREANRQRKNNPQQKGNGKKPQSESSSQKRNTATKGSQPQRKPQGKPILQREEKPQNSSAKRKRPGSNVNSSQNQREKSRALNEKKSSALNNYIDKSRQTRSEKINKDYNEGLKSGHSSDEVRRTQATKKKRSKKAKVIAALTATVFAVVLIIALFFYISGKPIVNINVEGAKIYKEKQIVEASGILVGDNMFRVSERRTSKHLSNVLPYIESVDVDYQFPDTILLTVHETADRFLITGNKKNICIDETGKVLSTKKKKLKAGQYKLKGFDNKKVFKESEKYKPEGKDKERFEKAKMLITILEANGLDKVNSFELADLNNIIITYDSRVNIYLGDAENPEEKLALVAKVIGIEVDKTTTGYIEARYANKVFFKEGSMIQA